MPTAPVSSWNTKKLRLVSTKVTMPLNRKPQPARKVSGGTVQNCMVFVTRVLARVWPSEAATKTINPPAIKNRRVSTMAKRKYFLTGNDGMIAVFKIPARQFCTGGDAVTI